MKLVRFAVDDNVRTGALIGDGIVDLHEVIPGLEREAAPGDTLALISLGSARLAELGQLVSQQADKAQGGRKLLAPLVNPPKIICAWVNYPNPAVATLPQVPIFFSKYASAITGPGEPIKLPRVGDQIVVEPELTAVIGKGGSDISEADALSHVAGYTIVNDVTAFSHRLQNFLGSPGPYMMAKTFDSFAPMGPCIVTADEIADPHSLDIRQYQNGELMTESNSSRAIFKLPQLINYLSQHLTLQPGDLILTGSPPPSSGKPAFLADGDHIRIEIDGVGVLENPVVKVG
ncbi:MAG: fumarylacetoacetate hydrolase family protein [Spongiibacteraceae bacterium]|jgi:2-keto-4-pentenoate hydratase/2-oxohepta-3-ene-1,7-dioic acid hydratase in catechol pathway|nr:fumarylacetoacetate hydrolase family protein [Spongiibacteraceae bacterium]